MADSTAATDPWASGAYGADDAAYDTTVDPSYDQADVAYDPNSAYYDAATADNAYAYAAYDELQSVGGAQVADVPCENQEYGGYDQGAYDQAAMDAYNETLAAQAAYSSYGAYDETTDWSDPNAYQAYAHTADTDASYFPLDEVDPNAPTSPFGDEKYWQQYGDDAANLAEETEDHAANEVQPIENDTVENLPSIETAGTVTPATDPATDGNGAETVPSDTVVTSTPPSSSPGKPRAKKKKAKTKQERVEMRQAQLEKEEADGTTNQETHPNDVATTATTATAQKQPEKRVAATRPLTFLERERAKMRLQMRKARAIARKRIPLQVRILTETRKHLSPMEIFFGGSVEAALSDLFWASIKGDLRRVRFLVEVEKISVNDCELDPWHMEQTPLHWAAKGGASAVIEYLIQAGANPRSLDETGSMPLHLACWGGHIDAALALLRATDTKDLYVHDYDAGLAALDWAHIRGHTKLVQAIEKYEDTLWLPKFIEDLIRGIIRYKIKLFKETVKAPKSPTNRINFRRAKDTKPPPATGDATNQSPTTPPPSSSPSIQATDASKATDTQQPPQAST